MHLRRLRHALPLLAVLGLTGMSFPATEGMQVSTAASKCGVTSSALLAWNPGSVGHTYNGTPYLISGATVTCPGDPGVGWSVHRPYSPPAPTPAQLARAIDRSEVVISQNPQEPGFLFMHTAPGVRGGKLFGQIQVTGSTATAYVFQGDESTGYAKVEIGLMPVVPEVDEGCGCRAL